MENVHTKNTLDSNIQDLAEVMVEKYASAFGHDESSIQIETIGIRPGEKIHEILVTPEECLYVEEKQDMFILRTTQSVSKNTSCVNSGNVTLMTKEEISRVLDTVVNVKRIIEHQYRNLSSR